MLKEAYAKYKKWIDYNKELLFGEVGAFIFGPLFAYIISLFYDSNILIAVVSSVGDYLGYTLLFAVEFFFDNKKLYWDSEKHKLTTLFYKHMGKFIIGAAMVDVIYYMVRGILNFAFLDFGLSAVLSAIISQILMIGIYFALMNIMGHFTGIIEKKDASASMPIKH